jgi:restriction system protein
MKISANTLHADQYIIGNERYTYNRYGEIIRIYIPFTHKTLNIFKELSGPDGYSIQQKFEVLVNDWDKKYEKYLKMQQGSLGVQSAEDLQISNDKKIFDISQILAHTLNVSDIVDWDILKAKPNPPAPPKKLKYPNCPVLYKPKFVDPSEEMGFFSLLSGRKKKAHLLAKQTHESDLRRAEINFKEAQEIFRQHCQYIDNEYEKQLTEHRISMENHLMEIETQNIKIEHLRDNWKNGNIDAVIEHASLVLENSEYPDWITVSHELQYDATQRLMKIQFYLPQPQTADIPKSVKFVKTTGELKITPRPKKEQQDLYDSLCYQIALRTVHELFEADTVDHFEHILFNGVVEATNPATGQKALATIMSAMFERNKFHTVNLALVDPKSCFKSFNGVAASSLAGLAPVPPVMEFDTTDRRFIEARSVSGDEASLSNLASMSWEDFEHLVREVFEKEFSSRGGEVKVTQSSSDGGVDAVAFDPDPITGGKIVIQAKRYTKTVGVSAVRDLYGTTLNEGASKGILVTTADYGPDAYKFAADKPMSLLNGSNLLFLLERHGMNAKIDLKEARQKMGLN